MRKNEQSPKTGNVDKHIKIHEIFKHSIKAIHQTHFSFVKHKYFIFNGRTSNLDFRLHANAYFYVGTLLCILAALN